MNDHRCQQSHRHGDHPPVHPPGRRPPLGRHWLQFSTLITGALALVWLLLRSGPKPSRIAYPCQQAAFSTASLAFGLPVVAAVVLARRRVAAWLRTPAGVTVAAAGLCLTLGMWGYFSWADTYTGPRLDPPADYRAQVFHVTQCPQDPVGEQFVGLNNLLALMGREGLKFYKSATSSLLGGPDGIIAPDDVVVIKINYQWPERGGTNTDLLRGLIRRIVDHPDTFTGEVVVCENTQGEQSYNFDRSANNAQDITLSPRDVVDGFASLGYSVGRFDWKNIRHLSVDEYTNGDVGNGYVVYDWDSVLHGRVSYPKFQSTFGTMISLRYGIWDPDTSTYDREHLKFINVPVLKSHHASYGATACVKNYMGVVSQLLGTNSHNAIRFGILGAVQCEIQPADLNILDCICINARPDDGPWCSYDNATRRDELVASTDPVAADIWAVTNILIPGFIDNNYSPPWPQPSADPDDPNSDFREYLDNSMYQLLAAGYEVTNDPSQIDTFTWDGRGDFDGDSDVDYDDHLTFAGCFTGPDGGPVDPDCAAADFDGDGDVDCDDWAEFRSRWTGMPPRAPLLRQCLGTPQSVTVQPLP